VAGTRYGLPGVATGVVLAISLNYFVGAWMSLRLLGASWRDYIRSQAPALGLGLVTLAVAHLIRQSLFNAGAAPIIVLGLTGLLTLSLIGGLCLLQPALTGYYGGMALRHLKSEVGSRFVRRGAV
jgi:hypothetical protein